MPIKKMSLKSIRMGLFVWCLSFLLLGICPYGYGDEVRIKFNELSQFIEKRNSNVASGVIAVEAVESTMGHLKRSFLPEVGVHAGVESFRTGPYSPATQLQGGVDVSINVFRGGKDALEEEVRLAQADAAKARSKRIFHEELASAQSLYWDIAYQQEVVKITNSTLESNERGYQAASQRHKRGLVAKTDLLEFNIYRGQLQEALESARHELQLLNISLRSVLGLSETITISTENKILHEHDDQLTKQNFNISNIPEVSLLNLNRSIADLQTDKARRWWVPEVELYGTYSLYTLRERFYPNLNDRVDVAGGIRLHIPIFDRFQGRTEVKTNALLMASIEKQAEQKARAVNAQIQVTQGEMIHLHELIHISEQRITEGQAYLNQTIDEYNRGVKNSPDLLSAIERLQRFRGQYLDRRKDYSKAKVRLLAMLCYL